MVSPTVLEEEDDNNDGGGDDDDGGDDGDGGEEVEGGDDGVHASSRYPSQQSRYQNEFVDLLMLNEDGDDLTADEIG